jgi:hypothetical protein
LSVVFGKYKAFQVAGQFAGTNYPSQPGHTKNWTSPALTGKPVKIGLEIGQSTLKPSPGDRDLAKKVELELLLPKYGVANCISLWYSWVAL